MKRHCGSTRVLLVLLTTVALPMAYLSANSISGCLYGEETIGNSPLNEMNYKAWKNIMPVANHKSRVYHTWVNGNERFYYQGSIDQLNELLAAFSKLEQDQREIVLLPGPGSVSNFDQDQNFRFNCEMHLVGGIASHQTKLDKGSLFWPSHPRLTIRVDEKMDLNALRVPVECKLVSPAELKRRYMDGLTSTDKTVRGWGIADLATLDPYDPDVQNTVGGMLDDQDKWVALNAIVTIGRLGNQSQAMLPRLEAIAKEEPKDNAQAASKAIESIKAAGQKKQIEKDEQQRKDFQSRLESIIVFIDKHRAPEIR